MSHTSLNGEYHDCHPEKRIPNKIDQIRALLLRTLVSYSFLACSCNVRVRSTRDHNEEVGSDANVEEEVEIEEDGEDGDEELFTCAGTDEAVI